MPVCQTTRRCGQWCARSGRLPGCCRIALCLYRKCAASLDGAALMPAHASMCRSVVGCHRLRSPFEMPTTRCVRGCTGAVDRIVNARIAVPWYGYSKRYEGCDAARSEDSSLNALPRQRRGARYPVRFEIPGVAARGDRTDLIPCAGQTARRFATEMQWRSDSKRKKPRAIVYRTVPVLQETDGGGPRRCREAAMRRIVMIYGGMRTRWHMAQAIRIQDCTLDGCESGSLH